MRVLVAKLHVSRLVVQRDRRFAVVSCLPPEPKMRPAGADEAMGQEPVGAIRSLLQELLGRAQGLAEPARVHAE